MSGIDVMKEIKDVEPSVLVLIATVCGDEEVAGEAFRNGARDYLKKLFSISEPSRREDILQDPKRRRSRGCHIRL
jgi:DNA-binding response OmpR family regulator